MEMRTQCEKCEDALTHDGVAYICSHECTYCHGCFDDLKGVCLNCSGELVRRPRRVITAVA